MERDSDTYYMMQFRDGDESAFRVLFTKHKKRVLNFCYRFCGDVSVAEELTQEVFLRVYKASPTYRPGAKFTTWLFKIATNVCLNEVRKTRYKIREDSFDASFESTAAETATRRETKQAYDILEDKEREKFVRHAIAELPKKERAALLLRTYNGFSYQEIGEQLKTSESAVKTILYRGRQRLKHSLNKMLKEDQ